MTILAWDGVTLAADRMSSSCGTQRTARKIFKVHYAHLTITPRRRPDGYYLLAICGGYAEGLALVAWWESGADPTEWPTWQKKDDFTELWVVYPDGRTGHFEYLPVFMPCLEPNWASGSGEQFAIGAMAHGASAVEAVIIASEHAEKCGMGIDTLTLTG